MIFKRKLYTDLLEWKNVSNGTTAMLIKGARRVDFLLSDGDKIDPLEMKSSGYKTHSSLDAFFKKYHDRLRRQYLVYTKDLRKDGMVTCLPIYMSQSL